MILVSAGLPSTPSPGRGLGFQDKPCEPSSRPSRRFSSDGFGSSSQKNEKFWSMRFDPHAIRFELDLVEVGLDSIRSEEETRVRHPSPSRVCLWTPPIDKCCLSGSVPRLDHPSANHRDRFVRISESFITFCPPFRLSSSPLISLFLLSAVASRLRFHKARSRPSLPPSPQRPVLC